MLHTSFQMHPASSKKKRQRHHALAEEPLPHKRFLKHPLLMWGQILVSGARILAVCRCDSASYIRKHFSISAEWISEDPGALIAPWLSASMKISLLFQSLSIGTQEQARNANISAWYTDSWRLRLKEALLFEWTSSHSTCFLNVANHHMQGHKISLVTRQRGIDFEDCPSAHHPSCASKTSRSHDVRLGASTILPGCKIYVPILE